MSKGLTARLQSVPYAPTVTLYSNGVHVVAQHWEGKTIITVVTAPVGNTVQLLTSMDGFVPHNVGLATTGYESLEFCFDVVFG